jgi:signal transduction histidine kinase
MSSDTAEGVLGVSVGRRPDAPAPRIDLAGSDTSIVVRADREALARAVRNLIDNALKYAAGTPVVDVAVATDGADVSIAVRDSGPGIDPAHQRTIFDKFVRAGGRQTTVRGTGLGLAMVRLIVMAHGGRIDLDSEIGRGSTFTIVLPAVGETAEVAGEA